MQQMPHSPLWDPLDCLIKEANWRHFFITLSLSHLFVRSWESNACGKSIGTLGYLKYWCHCRFQGGSTWHGCLNGGSLPPAGNDHHLLVSRRPWSNLSPMAPLKKRSPSWHLLLPQKKSISFLLRSKGNGRRLTKRIKLKCSKMCTLSKFSNPIHPPSQFFNFENGFRRKHVWHRVTCVTRRREVIFQTCKVQVPAGPSMIHRWIPASCSARGSRTLLSEWSYTAPVDHSLTWKSLWNWSPVSNEPVPVLWPLLI